MLNIIEEKNLLLSTAITCGYNKDKETKLEHERELHALKFKSINLVHYLNVCMHIFKFLT